MASRWREFLVRVLMHGDEVHLIILQRWTLRIW
jgi:hypothetical protein